MFPTTMTLLANPLKIHFLEYCQTNISLTGSQIHQSWVCLFSLFLPSTNKSLFENPIFCFHWWVTIHQWTEFQYPIPLMSKFPVLSISLFPAESGQHPNRKVPCFTNKVLEWHKHVFQIHNFPWFSIFTWWQDQSYSSANYIHCSAKLSVNFHNSQFTTVLSLSVSARRLSFRFFFLRVVTWVRSDWAPM